MMSVCSFVCFRLLFGSFPLLDSQRPLRFHRHRGLSWTNLRDLIGNRKCILEGVAPNCLLLRNIAAYMTDLFVMFGVIPKSGEIGFHRSVRFVIIQGACLVVRLCCNQVMF
ncbi:hypothetical protein COOONC_12320 [Cooperia oncophora]